MMKLRLYHYWRSSCSWRVRAGIIHKQLSVEFVHVDLLGGETESPQYLARNPLGYVPTLEVIDSDGKSRHLSESLAILHFLDEVYPEPSLLGGSDPWVRAQVRALSEIINADTQPLQNIPVMDRHSGDAEEKKRWSQHWIKNGLLAYETLAKQTSGRFSVGDQLTLADFCLIPQIYNARRFEVDLGPFPTLLRIETEAKKLPTYTQTEPSLFEPKSARKP